MRIKMENMENIIVAIGTKCEMSYNLTFSSII